MQVYVVDEVEHVEETGEVGSSLAGLAVYVLDVRVELGEELLVVFLDVVAAILEVQEAVLPFVSDAVDAVVLEVV